MTMLAEPMTMTKKESAPVRLNAEAIEEAKVAAATKGLSLVEYASKILLEAARRDNDEWSKARAQAAAKRPKGEK
jgi:predicted HicB family RNase H-like nuclease